MCITPGMLALRIGTQRHQLGSTSWRQSRSDAEPRRPLLETLQCFRNSAQYEHGHGMSVPWCAVVQQGWQRQQLGKYSSFLRLW